MALLAAPLCTTTTTTTTTTTAFVLTTPTTFAARGSTTTTISSSSSSLSSSSEFDFDVAIIGCGVGGHGAALHARGQNLQTAVFAGGDVGGTCVNRGCVPSKALLAASGRVREMRNVDHLAELGIRIQGVQGDDNDDNGVTYDRAALAAHAANLASRVKTNLEGSLTSLGCQVMEGRGSLTANPHEIVDSVTGKVYTAKVCICMFLSQDG